MIVMSKNFNISEFACKCCSKVKIYNELINELQKIRDIFGVMIVSSAYRCEKHNKEIGGANNSLHTKGLAVDIIFKDVNWNSKKDKLELLKFIKNETNIYRIGIYSWGLHLDIFYNPNYRYWKRVNGKYIKMSKIEEMV